MPTCRSTRRNPIFVINSASLEYLLHALNRSLLSTAWPEPDSKIAQMTTRIESVRPKTMLLGPASEIKFEEDIAEVEGANRCKSHCDNYSDELDRVHGYNLDLGQLVQAGIAAPGMSMRTEMQLVMVDQIIDFHADHLPHVSCKKSKPPRKPHVHHVCSTM